MQVTTDPQSQTYCKFHTNFIHFMWLHTTSGKTQFWLKLSLVTLLSLDCLFSLEAAQTFKVGTELNMPV
jgi:hypothetical protein